MRLASPRVSVVVPTYNAWPKVQEALNSVLAQDYSGEIECIVSDDGSTDETVERVVSEFPSVIVVEGANAGAAVARNRGVAEARGELVGFLDDDDLWVGDFVATQAGRLADVPGAAGILAEEVGSTSEKDFGLTPLQFRSTLATLTGGKGCSAWMFRASVFQEAGGFDPRFRRFQDYEFLIRVLGLGYSIYSGTGDHPLFVRERASRRSSSYPAENARALELLASMYSPDLAPAYAHQHFPICELQAISRSLYRNAASVYLTAGLAQEAARCAESVMNAPGHAPFWARFIASAPPSTLRQLGKARKLL